MPAPRKVTDAQLEELLAWMELHSQQAKNSQLGSARGKAASYNLWEQLASRLNALGSGTTKTVKEWRLYWSDLKCKVRRKGSLLLQHGRGTGGGPAANILTPIEERVLSLIGVQNVVGVESVRHEVDMGLDEPVAEPLVVVEPLDFQPLQTTPPKGYPEPQPFSQGHPLKRKHTGKSEESPMEKSRRMGPPQWALDLEERRLALDAERLEENRRFHMKILDQQEKFQTELLSVLKELVRVVRQPDLDEL